MKQNEHKDQTPHQETHVSLTEALSALEGMLSNPPQTSSSSDTSNQVAPSPPLSQDDEPSPGQATIPVLSEKILSNKEPPFPVSSDATGNGETLLTSPLYGEDSSKAVDRLANELRAIVQTGIEESSQIAAERITAQIKHHIETALPQILNDIQHPNPRRNP